MGRKGRGDKGRERGERGEEWIEEKREEGKGKDRERSEGEL
jgi:hypothetical protein